MTKDYGCFYTVANLSPADEDDLLRNASNDPNSRDRLICSYFKLVLQISNRYRGQIFNPPIAQEELIHEGLMGLYQAIAKYDPEKRSPFSSFARIHILNAIRQFLRKNSFQIHVPNNKLFNAFKLKRFIVYHLKTTGEEPTQEQICSFMDTSSENIEKFRKIISIHLEEYRDDYPIPVSPVPFGDEDLAALALDIIDKFSLDDQKLMFFRYQRDLSWRDIGELMDLSHEAVRKRHNKLITLLRDALTSESVCLGEK